MPAADRKKEMDGFIVLESPVGLDANKRRSVNNESSVNKALGQAGCSGKDFESPLLPAADWANVYVDELFAGIITDSTAT